MLIKLKSGQWGILSPLDGVRLAVSSLYAQLS